MKKQRQMNSIVFQVVFFPVGIVILILIMSIFLCLFSIKVLGNREIENNRNAMQIILNQLQNELDQLDHAFAEYLSASKSYLYLSQVKDKKPIDMFLEYQMETINWMNSQISMYPNVEGAFMYYENLDLLLFRGSANRMMHEYIKSQMYQEGEYGHWELVEIEKQWYLVNIKKYNNFYGGAWLSAEKIQEQLKFKDEEYISSMYIMDYKNENTVIQEEIHDQLHNVGYENKKIKLQLEDGDYYSYIIRPQTGDICFGIIMSGDFFYSHIPITVKGIIVLLFISILLVPILIIWLRKKIVLPIQTLDQAMNAVAEGDMEYRIKEGPGKHANELERLAGGFNHMVDEINELEANLFRTKIREEKIKMKYISQMIRPHFVLNALNIIYTYREAEFPLVKRMIRYLMEYFRYIVYLRTDFVTLEQEMHHIENYLKIQKERYLDAFDFFVEWESEASKYMIPPLIIQTFAENCLKYGKRDDAGIFVYVLASIKEDRIRLMIADSGNGFSKEMLEKLRVFIDTREHSEELGVGIQNAIERMDILYEDKVGVNIYNALSGGAVVELLLPVID